MKKATLVILALAMLVPVAAMAQTTGSGTLAVTATVQSSIYLTLESASGGATLGGTGTPNAALALGTVSAFGTAPAGTTQVLVPVASTAPTAFTISTPIGIKVVMFNASTSGAYTLTAALATADTQGNTWTLDNKALSTTAVSINGGTAGPTAASHNFALTILTSLSSGSAGTLVSNTINLVATAS